MYTVEINTWKTRYGYLIPWTATFKSYRAAFNAVDHFWEKHPDWEYYITDSRGYLVHRRDSLNPWE